MFEKWRSTCFGSRTDVQSLHITHRIWAREKHFCGALNMDNLNMRCYQNISWKFYELNMARASGSRAILLKYLLTHFTKNFCIIFTQCKRQIYRIYQGLCSEMLKVKASMLYHFGNWKLPLRLWPLHLGFPLNSTFMVRTWILKFTSSGFIVPAAIFCFFVRK